MDSSAISTNRFQSLAQRPRGSGALVKGAPRFLLVGPYDPTGGEYTFLAPPLGVWRLAGVVSEARLPVDICDPTCCEGALEAALKAVLLTQPWDVVGFPTTGMTLRVWGGKRS